MAQDHRRHPSDSGVVAAEACHPLGNPDTVAVSSTLHNDYDFDSQIENRRFLWELFALQELVDEVLVPVVVEYTIEHACERGNTPSEHACTDACLIWYLGFPALSACVGPFPLTIQPSELFSWGRIEAVTQDKALHAKNK